MTNYDVFLFLDENDTTGESNIYMCELSDTMTLDISGTSADLSIMVKSDYESNDFHEVGAISMADYKIKNTIENVGHYIVPLRGVQQIKIVNNGTPGDCKVFGVFTYVQ